MALIEKATEYILSIITEDETVKNFPKEFIAESAKWIRSWFLKDDPKLEGKISALNKSVDFKRAIIETKLEDFEKDDAFLNALKGQLASFEKQKNSIKNVVDNSNIEAVGNAHIGDKAGFSGLQLGEKNVVKGSTLKVGGDFHLGDG